MKKIILHFGLIGLLGYLFIGLFLLTVSGQTMSNQDYIIQTQDVNAATNLETNIDKPKTKPDLSISEGVNFRVKTGFENIVSALPFSVSLSQDFVDFGSLSPTNPIVRTVDLGVYSLSAYGYSVVASEDHPLQTNPDTSGANIPDTTCDNGECNQENAGAWISILTYGFGYRCDNVTGLSCDSSFSKPNVYKHFADISNGQSPQSVVAGIGSKNKDVRLSYKVNIPGSQAQGIYSNIITYIAVPNF